MASTETDWLQQLKDAPQEHSPHDRAAPDFTIFEVPEHIRVVSSADFESQGLQLGLSNRTLQDSGVQLLKVELARILDTELRKENPPRSWIVFTDFVVSVPAIASARRLYQSPSKLSDSVVQFQLALDALFLVAFFQFRTERDVLDEFRNVFKNSRWTIRKADFMLLGNQVPMCMLEAANRQLCEIRNPALTEEYVEDMLDLVLKAAVIYLHPFAYPDEAASMGNKCGCFCGWGSGPRGGEEEEKWWDYLDIHYPVQPAPGSSSEPLSNCAHILACVYRVICGHFLTAKVENSCAARLAAIHIRGHSSCITKVQEDVRVANKLPALPSATILKMSGIDVADTAWSLRDIQLSGWGYIKNATICLPKLNIYDETAVVFRNLAIYEQLSNEECGDLRSFLQCMGYLLVNAEDVDLLTRKSVINGFVNNETLLMMWHRAMEGVFSPSPSKAWVKLHKSIRTHRQNCWKVWRPECHSLFCAKPWQYSRWIVALGLIIFTFIQAWVAVVNAPKLKWHFVWA